MKKQGKDGRFIRMRQIWMPESWDNGYMDSKGRFRVYRPDCPRSYTGGYAMRAHVVWWLTTGKAHEKGTNLHHKNGDLSDDRFANLEKLSHGDHIRKHQAHGDVELLCEHCKQTFKIASRKVNGRIREGTPVRFCSLKCYWAHPKPKTMIEKICPECGKKFEIIGWRAARVTYCGLSCGAKAGWRTRKFAS